VLVGLKNLEQHKQIDSYLNHWKRNKPDNNILNWCEAMLKNNNDVALNIETQINTQAGGTPGDPKYANPEFEIVKTIAKKFKL